MKRGTVGTSRSYKSFSWHFKLAPKARCADYLYRSELIILTPVAQSKVKSLKREERQTTMSKGPDKFLEDAFNAADKK